MIKIKFCGISRACDVEVINELMPDYVGFIFAEQSKRYINYQQAERLKKILSPKIKTVGVFVDEDIEKIISFSSILDAIQLHGLETEDYIQKLHSLTDKIIIKAFKIDNIADIDEAIASTADYILFDSGNGTGKIFNWNILKNKNISRPYFLAGGLAPDNVKDAIAILNPFAVDVSSGIESNGLKDKSKMAEFVTAVKNAEEKIQ